MLYQENIIEFIDKNQKEYVDYSKSIFANPELSSHEFYAQKLLGEILEKNNFQVEYSIASHETGFIARKTSNKQGPKIAFLAEYDALPKIGHACGHNLIGVASVLAGISIGNIIDDLGGEVIVFGCPAEEGGDNGSAKATYVKEGCFKDVDVALMFHPSSENISTQRGRSVEPIKVEFFGKTAHAAANPENGINALHALLQFYNILHSYQLGKFKKLNIHGVILEGGTVPNIIPDYAEANFFVRGDKSKESKDAVETIKEIIEGVDKAFGTSSKLTYFSNRIDNFVITPTFDNLFSEVFRELSGEEFEVKYTGRGGSTDAANVSHVVPTIHEFISIGKDLVAHTTEFAEAASSERGYNVLLLAAKSLALTALKLYKDNSLLDNIKKDWLEQISLEK